jgi:hypothetical protein
MEQSRLPGEQLVQGTNKYYKEGTIFYRPWNKS